MTSDFQADIDAIARIEAVKTILDVVCQSTGMGFAAVARVTEDRWIVCSARDTIDFGLAPGGELKVETTICDEIRQTRQAVVIDHVAGDAAFRDHATPALYGFQSYISMPIIRQDGSFFGTLCAIDPRPAKLNNPATIGMFEMFAQLIAAQLDAEENVLLARAGLASAQQMAELREQFIGILGHDLRNPLAAIGSGTAMLLKTPLNDKATRIVALMQGAVGRMESLINTVLDFARSRMGSGLELELKRAEIGPALQQVMDELQVTHPDRSIVARFEAEGLLQADGARISQLFSNLLANALTHGDPDRPIEVTALLVDNTFSLSVANAGEPIPPELQAALFRPFSRSARNSGGSGLGLGLYISDQIAKAHGGSIAVQSGEDQTRFTFTMPVT